MGITEEHVRPLTDRFSRGQWIVAGVILGFFLGFVDTLLIAALLGYVGLTVPAYVGVPTTFTGYFFTGMITGKLAPPRVEWEPPAGVLVCVFLFMLGFTGVSGQGVWLILLHYVLIPAVAVGICYVGLRAGRGDLAWPRKKVQAKDQEKPGDVETTAR